MKGRVVDGSGKPVKGAQVDTGGMEYRDERTPVATNELGEYTLRNREAGPTIVTAQAEGFAPEFREVRVPNRGEVEVPVIRLGKASTLRVRVVDRAGKPVAGAYVAADTWRGHRLWLSLRAQTDPTGLYSTVKPMPQGDSPGQVPRATPCSTISLKMGICESDSWP